jgi:hypothetical protein
MPFLKTCRTCAVPVQIGKLYTWNSNGTITPKRDPGHRMLFYECKHLDRLFAGIEDLIGMSIERQIIESKSRSVIQYIKNERWWPRGALARSFVRPIVKGLTDGAIINGYGLIEVRELHWRKGYLHCQVTEPYSLPLLCGDISGAFESVLHKTNTVEYEQTGPGRYDLKCFWAPHAPELADRLLPRDATAKPGDLEHVRCGECGVPLEISKVRWDFEKGTITNDVLGVRVALFGASAIQAIFDELESELGQEIPNVIIEAQRKYSLGLATERSRGAQGEDLKLAMAVTGLGNLVQVDAKTDGYVTRIENPSLPLVTVGNALAFYEFLTGKKGSARWEIASDGDLLVELSPG